MPRFGRTSRSRLNTCHEDLRSLFSAVVAGFDCSILYGHRSVEEQQALYAIGRTKEKDRDPVTNIDGVKKKSLHNYIPSIAVDVAPYPIDFNDIDRIRYFAGYVMGMAAALNIKLRWGGDWDQDTEVKDNTFNDLLHFELVGVK